MSKIKVCALPPRAIDQGPFKIWTKSNFLNLQLREGTLLASLEMDGTLDFGCYSLQEDPENLNNFRPTQLKFVKL